MDLCVAKSVVLWFVLFILSKSKCISEFQFIKLYMQS